MNVGPAWQKGYTGKGVVVSILDDGIQRNHPDLDKNYVSMIFFVICQPNEKKGRKSFVFDVTESFFLLMSFSAYEI